MAAAYQSLEHPVADHAKAVMQVAAAGTGVRLSDGSTNVLPVGPPQQVPRGLGDCTPGWSAARWSAATTRAGTCTRPSSSPATRATYAFYREGLAGAATGCAHYLDRRGTAGVLDEPATAQALAGCLLRGLDCGAARRPTRCPRRPARAERGASTRLLRRGAETS